MYDVHIITYLSLIHAYSDKQNVLCVYSWFRRCMYENRELTDFLYDVDVYIHTYTHARERVYSIGISLYSVTLNHAAAL